MSSLLDIQNRDTTLFIDRLATDCRRTFPSVLRNAPRPEFMGRTSELPSRGSAWFVPFAAVSDPAVSWKQCTGGDATGGDATQPGVTLFVLSKASALLLHITRQQQRPLGCLPLATHRCIIEAVALWSRSSFVRRCSRSASRQRRPSSSSNLHDCGRDVAVSSCYIIDNTLCICGG